MDINQVKILNIQLESVNEKISKLENVKDYTDEVAKSFPMGLVGGSGRNTYRLNKRREQALEKTIDRAKILVPLYAKRNQINAQIKDIQEDGPAKRAAQHKERLTAKITYWQSLKVGDSLVLWTGNEATITKKNKKSIETGTGCKWSAAEIIGKEAAALLG